MTNPEEWTAFNRAEYVLLPKLEDELTCLEFSPPLVDSSNERSRRLRMAHLSKRIRAIRVRLGFSNG